jgi:hypothetical protein
MLGEQAYAEHRDILERVAIVQEFYIIAVE